MIFFKNLFYLQSTSRTVIHDSYDNPAREAISLYLAKLCNINVPEFKLFFISDNKSVLLTKRFDRNYKERIPYLSAKTFLLAQDGQSNDYAYLDIAQIIESNSSLTVEQNLQELFRRLIFNVLIGNKDDHLRNHGFLYIDNMWQLSPVFDLEISPNKLSHALALNDTGLLSCPLKIILETSEYYDLSYNEAKKILIDISDIVYDWKTAAKKLNILKSSIKLMPEYNEYLDEIKQLKQTKSI